MSYIDVTAKTEDEAINKALQQLGLERDDVSVEILERAKSGFLGLGSQPAKVRVTYGQPEQTEAKQPEVKKPEPKKEEIPKPEALKPAAPKAKPAERRPEPAKSVDKPASEPKRESAPAAEKPAPAKSADLGEEVNDEKAQAIRTFLDGLLRQLEVTATVHVYQPESGRYKVILEGENLGTIIGRRGETLDAIQQLTSYSINRSGSGRVRVQLDAENYRDRREQSLEHLARKTAAKVVKYRRSMTLEPMNAYERHVIHTALQDMPGITTYSTGTDPNRRVVVAFDREKK